MTALSPVAGWQCDDVSVRGLSSFHGGHSFHGDGEGQVLEIARAAADKGFVAFGFTEHFDRPPSSQFLLPGEEDFLVGRGAWTAPYVDAVRAAQDELGPRLPIRLGTEIEYIRGSEEWTRDSLSKWPFQYLVGSVHYLRYGDQDICIDCNRGRIDEAIRRASGVEQLQLDYYDHILELLELRLVQIVGHLDLIKIHMKAEESKPTPRVKAKIMEVLDAMATSEVAIDVNAAGLRKPAGEIYPSPWILENAARRHIPVTLGDDSHSPEQVGWGLDKAVDATARAGYSSVWLVGENGQLEASPLPSN
jgi:histidinol-phosphatase (PHP family)